MTATAAAMRGLLDRHNLPSGTALENRATWRLFRAGVLDRQQYRVGPYRLDYAWPDLLIALEVDGPHHWQPNVATKDVARDAYLRGLGWVVFRVDDSSGTLEHQLARVCRIVHTLRDELPSQRVSWERPSA